MLAWILSFSIIAGQLIKIPIGTHGGVTLLDISVVTLCLLGLTSLKFHFKKPPLFILAAIIFILIALFSLALTPLHLTPIEYFTSLSYTLRFSFYILLGWIIYSGAFPILRKNITSILIISGLGLATLGLLQFILLPDLGFLTSWGWDPHYFRTASTFLDPNFAGGFFVLTLILLINHKKTHLPTIVVYFVITYVALLTTFSRSSYLMFLISGLSLSFLKRLKILAFLVIALFMGLMLGFYLYTTVISKPRNIDRTQSAQFRLNTWQQGLTIFQSHPILGVGFNAYRYALQQYGLGDEQFISSHGASSNDSSLLYVAATTGIVGLISYLFFLFSLLKGGWAKNLILTSSVAGLVIHSFFANSLFYPPILLWIILTSQAPKK